jgi:hypothetical protein
VGTTDAAPYDNNAGSTADNGIVLSEAGWLSAARYQGGLAFLNRTGNDGELINFRKDGTTVGSIGTNSNQLVIDASASNLVLENSTRVITFSSSAFAGSGAANDAVIDLGISNRRFKNLYLSGGAYLGGTAAANHLDDYEEGTWTPTLFYASNLVYGSQSGKYIKIGRMVYVEFYINVTSHTNTDTSLIHIAGLPFTPNANDTLLITINTPESTLLKRNSDDSTPSSGGRIVNLADINICGQGTAYISYDECNSSGDLTGAAYYYSNT